MSRSPLITRHGLDDVLAWCPEGPVSVREFLADALVFAAQLPAQGQLINLCEDRYRFAVGFAAGLLRGKTSLQPSSQAPHSLRQVAEDYPGSVCLVDATAAPADLPALAVPARAGQGGPLPEAVPLIDDAQVAAILFTSGSTGRPQPHRKHWGRLVRNGQAEAAALGLLERPCSLVGTVPVQHSYGFESTLLLALHGGCRFWSGKPFYPQDIADALAAVPAPRMLVTTPFHLGNWLAAALPSVPLERVLSATAPLAEGLARQAEAASGAQVHEIYGSTESSALASRRTVDGAPWTLMQQVALRIEADVATASGGHVEGEVPLGDVLEPLPDGRFVLHGRIADLVNIAGKRTSLAYLNQQLAGLPGVVDAAFYLPDGADDAPGITRLAAFAVAPQHSAAQLVALLRERLDPIFLPRPLVLLPGLPRNATGKLTREALGALYRREVLHERRRAAPKALGPAVRSTAGCPLSAPEATPAFALERDWVVPADHPAFAGHFPGQPILPGVVLLDQALQAARTLAPGAARWALPQAKFLRTVAPGQLLRLRLRALPSSAFAFEFLHAGVVVAQGQLKPEPAAP